MIVDHKSAWLPLIIIVLIHHSRFKINHGKAFTCVIRTMMQCLFATVIHIIEILVCHVTNEKCPSIHCFNVINHIGNIIRQELRNQGDIPADRVSAPYFAATFTPIRILIVRKVRIILVFLYHIVHSKVLHRFRPIHTLLRIGKSVINDFHLLEIIIVNVSRIADISTWRPPPIRGYPQTHTNSNPPETALPSQNPR